MMWGKAEDAGGLAPAKDDNDAAASSRHRAADGIY